MSRPVALITLDALRRLAVARSLFKPTTLPKAIARLGFVQADPIRAPARAQDLTLRHRVINYCAGDLERRYAKLPIEEDFFVNYGFLPRATHTLMHPRTERSVWPKARWAQAHAVLEFVRARGEAHPRDVDAAFNHGKSKNWFGGNSNASTQLLDAMHYRGLVRIARRDSGVRVYAARDAHASAHTHASAHASTHSPATDASAAMNAMDTLVDVVLNKYAPMPERSLSELVSRLLYAAPQWADDRRAAMDRARARLPRVHIDGVPWLWPVGENPLSKRHALDQDLRLLAPFDPVVWDRRRFELFWGWAYRFEAYTPAPKRVRGYYALPLLWQGQVIGWGNVGVRDGVLQSELGFVKGRPPREAAFRQAWDEERARLGAFLGL